MVGKTSSQMAHTCLPFEKQGNTNKVLSPKRQTVFIVLTAFSKHSNIFVTVFHHLC